MAGNRFFNKRDNPIHDYPRVVTLEILRHPLTWTCPIVCAKGTSFHEACLNILRRLRGGNHRIPSWNFGLGDKTDIKTMIPRGGVVNIIFFFSTTIGISYVSGEGSQMPFAKMPGAVAFFFNHLSQGDLLGPNMTGVGTANTHSCGMSSGHNTCTSRRTYRACRVKTCKNCTILGHLI